MHDFGVSFHLVLVVERGVGSDHLVDQNSQRPPIHPLPVPASTHHLWCEVVGGTAERPCSVGGGGRGEGDVQSCGMLVEGVTKRAIDFVFHMRIYTCSTDTQTKTHARTHGPICNVFSKSEVGYFQVSLLVK